MRVKRGFDMHHNIYSGFDMQYNIGENGSYKFFRNFILSMQGIMLPKKIFVYNFYKINKGHIPNCKSIENES